MLIQFLLALLRFLVSIIDLQSGFPHVIRIAYNELAHNGSTFRVTRHRLRSKKLMR